MEGVLAMAQRKAKAKAKASAGRRALVDRTVPEALPLKKGAIYTGTLEAASPSKNLPGKLSQVIRLDKGKRFFLPNHALLEQQLIGMPAGTRVELEYQGTRKVKGRPHPMHEWEAFELNGAGGAAEAEAEDEDEDGLPF